MVYRVFLALVYRKRTRENQIACNEKPSTIDSAEATSARCLSQRLCSSTEKKYKLNGGIAIPLASYFSRAILNILTRVPTRSFTAPWASKKPTCSAITRLQGFRWCRRVATFLCHPP